MSKGGRCKKVCDLPDEEIVEEYEVVEDRNMIISYVKHGDNCLESTPIGKIVVDYLIREKLNPRAHVVYLNKCREYKSVYNFDLFDPISVLNLDDEIILNKTTFITLEEARDSMEKLLEFLASDSDMDYERETLAEKTRVELKKVMRKLAAAEELVFESSVRKSDIPFYSNPSVSVTPKTSRTAKLSGNTRLVTKTRSVGRVLPTFVPAVTPTLTPRSRSTRTSPILTTYDDESDD